MIGVSRRGGSMEVSTGLSCGLCSRILSFASGVVGVGEG